MATENAQKTDLTDAEFSQLTEWQAQFDTDTIDEIDSHWDDISSRRSRRLLLSILTMDSEKIFDCCENDPEAVYSPEAVVSAW